MRSIHDVVVEKIRTLRTGLDELAVLVNALGSMPEAAAPGGAVPVAVPDATRPAGASTKAKLANLLRDADRKRKQKLPEPPVAAPHRPAAKPAREKKGWTDDEKLELIDLIPNLPMRGQGSRAKRQAAIRKLALKYGRTELAVRAMIFTLRRDYHPDLMDMGQSARTRAARPWEKK